MELKKENLRNYSALYAVILSLKCL